MRQILGRPLHVSWLVAWFCMAAICGIALALIVDAAIFSSRGWLLAAAVLFAVCFKQRTFGMVMVAITAGLLLGLWRGSNEQTSLQAYQPYYGHNVSVRGTVSDDTSYSPHGDQRLVLENVYLNGRSLHGQVWISSDSKHDMQRSDIITLNGKLSKGFGSMPASMFRAQVIKVVRPQPGDIGLHLRDWFASGIHAAIPEPQASLAAGYLVGQRSTLPGDLDTQLKVVGLTHAVVASGYNLTILVSFARQIFLSTSKYLATLSGAAMIAGFLMISGLSPSMSRAGLVGSLSLAAWYYGRRVHPLVLLPFAAAVTAVINPSYVWGDLGWYLSFTSFAGVIVLAPLVHTYFWGAAKPGFVRSLVVDTLSAQAATLPIMVFAFGHYSPYALPANILVLPLVPLTMLLTFAAGAISLIMPGLAHLAGLPATFILKYMTWVVDKIASLPGSQGDLNISVLVLGLCYALLVAVIAYIWIKTRFNFREPITAKS